MTGPDAPEAGRVRVELIDLTPEATMRMAAGDLGWLLCAPMDADTEAGLRHVGETMAAFYERQPPVAPWGGYLGRTDAGQIVGLASFKGPIRNGEVEISYFTFPAFEGRGCAGAMASGMVEIAVASPERPTVIAHTLPEEGASTTVLRRLGFAFDGEVQDPEDGEVWRWVHTSAAPTVAD